MRRNATPEVLTPFNAKANGKDHTDHDKDVPIIIFTGIHGRAAEVYALASAMDKKHGGKSPIYICKSSYPDIRDAQSVADTILRVRNNSQYPYVLIGFSFGANLGAKVAELLQHQYTHSYSPILYGIDQASPENTYNYFELDHPSAHRDLLNIVNSSAEISGLAPLIESSDTFANFEMYFSERKLLELKNKLLAQQPNAPEEKIRRFKEQMEVVNQNLLSLTNSNPYLKKNLKSGNFIFTNETMAKQSALASGQHIPFTGGWDTCCETVQILRSEDGKLESLTHLDLVKEEHVNDLAELITASMKHEIKDSLKSIALRVVKNSFSADECDDADIKALEKTIPRYIKKSFQDFQFDDDTVHEITREAIKLLVQEAQEKADCVSHYKLTGQACNMFPANTRYKLQHNHSTATNASTRTPLAVKVQ